MSLQIETLEAEAATLREGLAEAETLRLRVQELEAKAVEREAQAVEQEVRFQMRLQEMERQLAERVEVPRIVQMEEELVNKDAALEKANNTIAEMVMKATADLDELLEAQGAMEKELEASKAETIKVEKKVQELSLKIPFFLSSAKNTTEPPEGQVTLVFTDVQSSTLQWEHRPDAMAKSLAIHNTMMRNLIAKHQGYEVKTEGDAFMV